MRWVGACPSRAAAAGYADDPEFTGYRFLRPINALGQRTIDGVEVD